MGVKDAAVAGGLCFGADAEDRPCRVCAGKLFKLDGGPLPGLHQLGILLVHGDVNPRAGQVQHLGECCPGVKVFAHRILQIGGHHDAVDGRA